MTHPPLGGGLWLLHDPVVLDGPVIPGVSAVFSWSEGQASAGP